MVCVYQLVVLFSSLCDKVTEPNVYLILEYISSEVCFKKHGFVQLGENRIQGNEEVKFPLIEDIKMDVAKKFGMIQPGASDTQAVRAVFIIDPSAVVRCILYYPSSTGRNFDEIKRIIVALQKADAQGIATPANWQLGDDVIVPPAGSCGVAQQRMETPPDGMYCLDWFLCLKKS